MYDRKQYRRALAGLIMTLVGLLTLFIVPIAVGIHLKGSLDGIERLERSRQAIDDAIQIAQRSDTFLMHRYLEPGATRGRYEAESEYSGLLTLWNAARANKDAADPLDPLGRSEWEQGTGIVSRWIEKYLSRYRRSGDPGGPTVFEREERTFRAGLSALARSSDGAANQQEALRKSQQWLNTAQLTVVAPMAVICFVLALLAWLNLRTLRQSWIREREASSQLALAVKESNHRIKNNLQVIGALIDMQIQEPGESVPKSSLEQIVNQVRAVAAVHDFFSHELRSEQIQCDHMLRRLVDLTSSPIGLRVDLQLDAIELAIKQATAVALITNELLLNSGKHGATEARVEMVAKGASALLRVSDNGPGFPSDFDAERSANLGLALVDSLARHDLHGKIRFDNYQGARVEVTFPLAPAV